MDINSWLFFDKMITPRIIKVVYWVLLFLTILSGILGVFINPVSIIITVISIIILRISCEVVILMFNIYQQIKRIADNISADRAEKSDMHNQKMFCQAAYCPVSSSSLRVSASIRDTRRGLCCGVPVGRS
ncbi:DUF4282 domain-containing protein [Salmonella enterica]|nr:DUF4282 domain-containing protein [Salmonella enterica]